MRYFKVLLFQTLLLSLVLFAANSALADSITFTLNNTGVSGGPFVNVTVDLTATGVATITFQSAGTALGMIDGSTLGLNVNTALGWTGAYNTLTSNGETLNASCVLCKTDKNLSGQQIDGFGRFNLVFDQQSASSLATTVSVTLTGGGWTSASQVLTSNGGASGSSAASHVTVGSNCTFFVGNGTTTSPASCAAVPEPSVYLGLLTSGVIGLFFVRRKWLV
jgi:hypothetical protein